MIAKKFIVKTAVGCELQEENLQIVEEKLVDLSDGEILCKAEWYSMDPLTLLLVRDVKLGETVPGTQVARVIKSKCAKYAEGILVVGNFGWRDLTIFNPEKQGEGFFWNVYQIPDLKGLPSSYALGAVGVTGFAAYCGYLKIREPKKVDTVVVSTAAGATGNIAGQLAKLNGCTVVGLTGSDEKVKWLKSLGFDFVFNYKTDDIPKLLAESCPKGIDVFFDTVGGLITTHVIRQMKLYGDVLQCGNIASYAKMNDSDGAPPLVHMDYHAMVFKQIRITCFNINRWEGEWIEYLCKLRDLVVEGKLRVRETITEGFEKIPTAFKEMMDGKNIGKAVVKA